jgi:NTE family protein
VSLPAAARKAATPRALAVKRVNLALQGGGSHGAYTWGALDALLEDERIEISGVSGASAGAMNAVLLAAGLQEDGRDGARKKLNDFWLSVSQEGTLPASERPLFDACMSVWKAAFTPQGWVDAISQITTPYEFNPLNVNPLRDHLVEIVDFEALRRGGDPKLFIAATNVHTGRGEIFRREILTVDHVMASACLPRLFQAVMIAGVPYWDGGFSGNPPLWPLFYETDCRDAIIVQINPIERDATPESAQDITNRMNEITFNASLLAELRAVDFVARLIEQGALKDNGYKREFLHRIGGDGKLETLGAETKLDVSWTFLTQLRDLGRDSAKAWLHGNFDAIGKHSTLDIAKTLRKTSGPKP